MASRYAMSKPERSQVDAGRAVPKPPASCGNYGCSGKADVLFMVVDDRGRKRCGAASEFAADGEKTHAMTMRDGYEFVRWIARCSTCYQADLAHTHRGKWDYVPPGTQAAGAFLRDGSLTPAQRAAAKLEIRSLLEKFGTVVRPEEPRP